MLDRTHSQVSTRRAFIAGASGLVVTALVAPKGTYAQDATPDAAMDEAAAPAEGAGAFTLYSGRNETLIAPLLEQYSAATGATIDARFGSTGEMAATLQEEGDATPASAFFAQDAGALGLMSEEGAFQVLPAEILDRVDERFRDPEGRWVGVTGRARVLAYNTETLSDADLPSSVNDLTDAAWKGRIGWAPENASFQAFVTAFRVLEGDDAAKTWLEAMIANEPVNFADSNSAIVEAIAAGEIDAGLVNNYYAYVIGAEQGPDFPVANHFFAAGDPGSLINIAGIGVIDGAEGADAALDFVAYLVSDEGQAYFAHNTYEYPVVVGAPQPEGLPPLSEIGHPEIDLTDLADLQGTLELMAEVGLL